MRAIEQLTAKPEFYGKIVREVEYEATCYECARAQLRRGGTMAQFKKRLRALDWSLDRDGNWRCDRCRPKRFGERG
jgi:hypothetical protein